MEGKSTRQRLIDENETSFYGLSRFDQSFPRVSLAVRQFNGITFTGIDDSSGC